MSLSRTVIDLLGQIRAEQPAIADLRTRIRALLAAAPPKPVDPPAGAPEAGQAARDAEIALDELLDGERAGRVTVNEVEAARKALAAARLKDARAAAEAASQAELVERRHAAFTRQLRPLQDELGQRGLRVDELVERIRLARREEAARVLFEAERALGEAAACVVAIGPLVNPRRLPPRQPVYIHGLPAVDSTKAFADFAGGGVRIVIDRDPKTPPARGDLEFSSTEIARAMQTELEAELAREPEQLSTTGA